MTTPAPQAVEGSARASRTSLANPLPARLLNSDAAGFAGLLAAVALFYWGPGLVFAVAGAAAYFVLGVWKPAVSLAVVPLTAPLFYRPRTLTGDKYVALAEAVILLGVAAWAARDGWTLLRTRRLPNVLAVLTRPEVIAAVALAAIATVWLLVPPPGEPRRIALREFRWTIVEPLLYFGMVLRWARRGPDVWRIVGAWLVAAAFVGREGAEQYFYGQTWSMEGVGRATSVYPSATAFGIYGGRALALSLSLAFFLPRSHLYWKVACALLSVPIGLGVLFSFARGAWIGVFVALVAVALLARSRPLLAAVGVAVLGGLALLPFVRVERITSMFNFDTPDNTGVSRFRIWESAWRIISDHPLTGIGQDQFLHADPKYGVPHVRFLTVSHPHNWVLDFWLRLGLPGLAWLVAALSLFFWNALAVWRERKGTAQGALALALAASMVDFAVHGLLDMAYFTQDLGITFWLTFALVFVLKREGDGLEPSPSLEARSA